MLNKRLLVSITLDKKRLSRRAEGSCIIECIPSIATLNGEEMQKLKESLELACDLLRLSYIRYLNDKSRKILNPQFNSYDR